MTTVSFFVKIFRKVRRVHRFNTLSKLYYVPVGWVSPPPLSRQCNAIFAVAEGLLLLDIGWFVLVLPFSATMQSTLPFLTDMKLIFNFVWKVFYPNLRIMFVV